MMTTSGGVEQLFVRLNPFSFGSHGHEAFCSSTFTSLKKFLILVNMIVEE